MSDIELYQTEWCPHSHRVRHLLTTHGVSYRTINVPAAQAARDRLERATGQRTIPALVVDGRAYTEWSEIGPLVAERFPVDRDFVGAHERLAAPAAAARLDSGEIEDLVAALRESFATSGFAVVDEPLTSPGSVRTCALVHDELNERLTEIEPRLRAMLPLRIALHRHDNGAVATVVLVNQLCMHFHNAELSRQTYRLDQTITEAFERVGDRSGVA